MHDFVSHVLRKYYAQTDWNPFNSYLHLTSSSHAVLDFAIPNGLSLSISASPSPPFFTTYRLRALPTLSGALGYIFASVEDDKGSSKGLDIGGNSKDIRFKDIIDRFRIVETPWQPIGKEQVFQGGKRVDGRDYLLYGCLHVPSSRVDALFTTRLDPNWQLLMTAISTPPRSVRPHVASDKTSDATLTAGANQTSVGSLPPGTTNFQLNLQRDTGRWFSEYSYSVDDGLLGFRVLHNLGQVGQPNDNSNYTDSSIAEEGGKDVKRVDEENTLENVVGGGLQGRFSVGAELFFSPLEKSAGLSTGVRFTTLPEGSSMPLSFLTNPSSGLLYDGQQQPSQPPTTITATLNPMMGHLSTAYAARMTNDIVACSRFDFNVYSYDSDLTLGAEYWLHYKATLPNQVGQEGTGKDDLASTRSPLSSPLATTTTPLPADRSLQARTNSKLSLRERQAVSSFTLQKEEPKWSLREESKDSMNLARDSNSDELSKEEEEETSAYTCTKLMEPQTVNTFGVIKGRLSTSGNVALLWEGRLRNCLVSFGIKADLSSNQGLGVGSARKPLRGVGMDIVYFTQNRQEKR